MYVNLDLNQFLHLDSCFYNMEISPHKGKIQILDKFAKSIPTHGSSHIKANDTEILLLYI